MKIHDTHAHLDYLLKQNPELKIDDLIKNHEFWIQPGVNLERDRYCLENYLNYKNMFFMIGAHPGEVKDNWDLEEYLIGQQVLIRDFEKYIHNRIVAIGEIGLDYRSDTTENIKTEQQLLFNIQIKLAKELNLPFVVHCRDAFDDMFTILESNLPFNKPFLIHCFTGNKDQLLKVEKLGGFCAFGGIVTYNNTPHINEALIKSTKYVIETDLPWLAPTPYRGKLNMPEYINNTIRYMADKKDQSINQIISTSRNNAITIFGPQIIDKHV